jgi:hypothetical protein
LDYVFILRERRTDQYGNIGRAPYLKSGDDEGRQLVHRSVTATARRVGLAAWKKRGGGWGMEIGPGRRLTPGRTAGEGSGEREDGSEQRLRRREDGGGAGEGLGAPPAHRVRSAAGPPLAPAAMLSPMLLLGGGRAEREGSLLCHTPIRQSTHATQRRSKMVLSFARSGG